MTKTQKALRLVAKELRDQRTLLEKLLDGVMYHEASVRMLLQQGKRNTDLLSGLQVLVSEHVEDTTQRQRLQDEQIQKHHERLRALETVG